MGSVIISFAAQDRIQISYVSFRVSLAISLSFTPSEGDTNEN
jgi:hypothetical protein